MAIPTFTKTGTKATTPAKLDASVFGLEVANHELLKQAYLTYQANGRTNNAVVKTRGLVSGGGKKPWKQKGTGRARFGSSRVPIWRGGGIVFGPTGNENYSKDLNVKAKRTAIRQALSVANESGKIIVIESFAATEGKTAAAAKLLNKVEAAGRVLLVVDNKDAMVERATRNLAGVKATHANYVNVFDVLNADKIVITQQAVDVITTWLATDKTAASATKEAK